MASSDLAPSRTAPASPDVLAKARILLADDQADVLQALRLLLKAEGCDIETATSPAGVLAAVDARDFDVALIDLNYTRDTTSGEEGLDAALATAAARHAHARRRHDGVGHAWTSPSRRCAAARATSSRSRGTTSACWPSSARRSSSAARCVAASASKPRTGCCATRARTSPSLIAESAAMRPVLELIARVGPSDANVLITGENGTGKGTVAQALHAVSSRATRPLVTVNAGGLSEGLFESELFGHVKGAFTDAKSDRVGRFELAEGGTLFLDEIANISLNLQAKLLRVLETGEFERVGSSRTRRANVRIISATNADLTAEVDVEPLPPGSPVPPEHDRDPAAAAARPPRRHSAAGAPLPRAARAALPQAPHRLRSRPPCSRCSITRGRATSASSITPSSAPC